MLNRFITYIREVATRRRVDAETDDELRFHLEHEVADNMARGMSATEARRVALRDLGGLTQTTEAVREVRMTWIDVIWRDVRYAVRTLRRTPAFTVSTLATLALVIGANTAVFSLVDAILLRPLDYPQPERLARVSWLTQPSETNGFSESVDGRTWEAVRDETTALDAAVTSGGRERVNFNTDADAAFVLQARVSAGYFRVLGIAPLIGREFTPDEDRPGGAPVVVLGHDFWTRALHADPSVVGRTVFLRGEAYQVVGVMPRGFAPTGMPADLFTPLRPSRTGEGGGNNYGIIARLREGHTWPEAEGELANASGPLLPPDALPAGVTRRLSAQPLHDALTAGVREPLHMLVGAGLMVLLIACVNIAALVMARGSGRKKEMATRLALGSGRAAVVRQCIVESLVLGVAGGALGLAVAHACLAALQAMGGDIFTQWTTAAIDARVVAATAAVSVLTAVVFGVVPAVSASRVDVSAAMTENGSRAIAGGARHWGRRALIAAEVALSVVLLVVTGLFVRTLANLDGLDPGFDARNVSATSVSLQDARYATAGDVHRLFDASLAALDRTPGVESAAVSLGLPYSRLLNFTFRFADRPADRNPIIANVMYVSPGFFDTLRIPLRSGRAFAPTDRAGQPAVAVVNDAFVRFLADGEDPIGRHLNMGGVDWQIVGVAGDMRTRSSGVFPAGMTRGPLVAPPIVFIAAAQLPDALLLAHQWFTPFWTIRTSGPVNADLVLRQAIAEADGLLPITPVERLEDAQAGATSFQRLLLTLIGAFAAVALLLAVIGIYGLIAQTVQERTREFGIRLALGATAGRTIRGVMLSGLAITVVGVVAGTTLAWGTTRLVVSFLWGVDQHDPLTFAAIAALLLAAATLASVLPALRIVRIDPARTLRG